MRFRHLLWLLVSSCGLTAGADVNGGGASDTPEALKGYVDAGDPAVGLVWTQNRAVTSLCTGTLIASDLVLTAAHCATAPVEGFYLGTGRAEAEQNDPDLLAGRERYEVDGQAVAPDWNGDCHSEVADLAVLHLAKTVLGVTPLVLADSPPVAGASCLAAGFGWHTGAGGARTVGQKRAGNEVVTEVSTARVVTRADSFVIEHGDSGGPLICDDKVVGAASCANPDTGVALYSRIDLVVGRIFEAGNLLRGN